MIRKRREVIAAVSMQMPAKFSAGQAFVELRGFWTKR